MQQKEHDRMGGKDSTKFASWIKPKAAFKKFLLGAMQLNVHMIFCFRASEKLAMVKVMKNGREVNEPVNTGWSPICTKGLDHEMTAMLVLPSGAKGVPQLGAQHEKMPIYLQQIFKPGTALSEATGEQLAAWASSTTKLEPIEQQPQVTREQEIEELLAGARDEAKRGLDHMTAFYRKQSPEDRKVLKAHEAELMALVPLEMDAGNGE
jgi:hypothetical protein